MRTQSKGFSYWFRQRVWPAHRLEGGQQLSEYEQRDITQTLGQTRHCHNLEQLKQLTPALSHGLQHVLDLNEQLLRDVLPVACEDGSVLLVLTEEALHTDAVHSLAQKMLAKGYRFNSTACVVVDTAVLLAVGRILPTKAAQYSLAGPFPESATSWSEAELYAMFLELVRWGLRNEASDLHINLALSEPFSQVYFSIAGRYVQPSVFTSMQTSLLRDMLAVVWMGVQGGNAPVFDMYQEQQGRIECEVDNQRLRLRWASLAAIDGPSVCFRILSRDHEMDFELSELGYLPEQEQQLLESALSERGAIVFSGSVGSGKSTALAALVGYLPDWRKVITLEDPVEYRIPHAVQVSLARELDTDTHQHFASKLRALKRSAMTDVLLGEIRDAETAQAFTDLVTSGVRVFTTVHAAGVHLITQRLSSSFIGVEREVLDTPGILRLLVHQELLPQLCPGCAIVLHDLEGFPPHVNHFLYQFRPFEQWLQRVKQLWGAGFEQLRVRNTAGCTYCESWQQRGLAGYTGRTVVAELWQPELSPKPEQSIHHCAWLKAGKGLLDPFDLEYHFGLFGRPHWQAWGKA